MTEAVDIPVQVWLGQKRPLVTGWGKQGVGDYFGFAVWLSVNIADGSDCTSDFMWNREIHLKINKGLFNNNRILTDVVGEEVSREAFGPVAQGCVVVRVASKNEQSAAEEHSWVQVPWKAAFSQNEPGACAWQACQGQLCQGDMQLPRCHI